MDKNNDQSNNPWENNEYPETPDSFPDAYRNAINQNRSGSRSNNPAQNEGPTGAGRTGGRPRDNSAGGRIYAENTEQPSRPRPTRQSREEVYSRHRQRPRQSASSRPDERGSRPPTRSSGPEPQSRRGENTYQQPPTARRTRDDGSSYEPQQRRGQEDYGAYRAPTTRRIRDDGYDQRPVTRSATGKASSGDQDEFAEYDELDIYEEEPVPQRRKHPTRPTHKPERRRKRGGRVVSTVLIGCLGGIITLAIVAGAVTFLILHNTSLGTTLNLGKSPFHQPGTQTLALGNATQLIVKNQVGNVSISVEQSATTSTLASVKNVLATNQSDANHQFGQIVLTTKQITQGTDPACLASSCLLITATVPTAPGGGLLGAGNSDSIDLTITLPSSFNSLGLGTTPNSISATTNTGNLTVDKFNGMLNLSGSTGNVNINVTNSLIFAGTCLQTTHGNITINQGSILNLNSPSTLVPCTTTLSDSDHPWFNVKTGIGNIAVTLTPLSTNLLLDANTNSGSISNGFGTSIPNSDGSASYHGPLVPGTTPTPVASLYVETSTGNIQIQKQ